MLASPLSVINETLDHLQTLSQFLLDEVDERVITSHQVTTERRLCKEALQTIKVLIPKLQAVRSTNVVVAIDHPRAWIVAMTRMTWCWNLSRQRSRQGTKGVSRGFVAACFGAINRPTTSSFQTRSAFIAASAESCWNAGLWKLPGVPLWWSFICRGRR